MLVPSTEVLLAQPDAIHIRPRLLALHELKRARLTTVGVSDRSLTLSDGRVHARCEVRLLLGFCWQLHFIGVRLLGLLAPNVLRMPWWEARA